MRLQRVTAAFEREVDATLQIVLESEVIETTAEHPFYTQQGWKDAADLTTADRIKTKNQQWQRIKGHNFLYQTKKVYNFEVENWHTYFVGMLGVLVHNNAKNCFSQIILASQRWFRNVRKGYFFNLVWNNELRKQALEKGFKYFQEVKVLLKNGKEGTIDGLIKLKNGKYIIIERKASDLTKVTDKTIKSYINDAYKYKGAELKGNLLNDDMLEKTILHVEKVGDLSENIIKHATKKEITIVDDLTGLF